MCDSGCETVEKFMELIKIVKFSLNFFHPKVLAQPLNLGN